MNYKTAVSIACLGLFAFAARAEKPKGAQLNAARDLIQRVAPSMATHLELIPAADGKDVYELESVGDQIVLRGNNGVSIASAFNRYLQDYCQCEYSLWGDQMALPDPLPPVPEKIRLVNERQYRHFFNYCTFNYSGSWWDWNDWQKIIDFLAMNGINMPLSIVGVEAVWYKTLIDLDLTHEQAMAFIASPVYLNWQWMSNLEGSGGPMPMSWIKSHQQLGRQIMDRQHALGMTPIVHGFSGHVPRIFREIYPEAKIDIKGRWAASSFIGAAQLDPTDPLFEKIGTVYLNNQIELLGTSHFYMADPFHEGTPPVEGDDYLTKVGKAISALYTKVDPEAIWAMQNWSVREPIVTAVDKDRLLLMDLNGSKWKKYKHLGYKFTVGQLNSFGDRTHMHGDLQHQANNIFNMARKESADCIGTGLWMEGIGNNPVNYHLALSMNWQADQVDLQQWLTAWTERRYGASSEHAAKAWHLLAKGPYSKGGYGYSSMLAARPLLHPTRSGPNQSLDIYYDTKDLAKAWELLLKDRKTLSSSPGYQYDVVDLGRQALANLAYFYQRDIEKAFLNKDRDHFNIAVDRFLMLFDDADELLATHEAFLFGKWLEDAGNWGTTPEEREYYEKQATMLVTLWGSDTDDPETCNYWLHGYAWREWAGLVKGYYKVRWEIFLGELAKKLDDGSEYKDPPTKIWRRPEFRANPALSKVAEWELNYVQNPPKNLNATPKGHPVETSLAMYTKYKKALMALPSGDPDTKK